MATRVVQILSDFVRWRWAPFVGLVGASLFYVLFAILLIPSKVGASETEEEASTLDAPESTGERGGDDVETDTQTSAPSPVKHIERSSPLPAAPAPKRRGFSPPLERPEPAPPSPPQAPPPPAPPPPATAEQVPAPSPAPGAPDPAAEEQQRVGAAAAARAATLAATRASRLSGRGLRPRVGSEVAVEAPVHEESEVASEGDEEEEDAPAAETNADPAEADDSESDAPAADAPAEAESPEAEDE